MLKVTDLKKNYSGFNLDVSFDVEPNQIVGLVGRNGAGKSTTFKSILNLITPDSGQIILFDKPINEFNQNDKQKIGTSLPGSTFSEDFTIQTISKIMASFYSQFDGVKFLSDVQKQGLPIDKKIKDFSTGMLAKLKILLALSYEPDFLVLDEPTNGLDVVVRQQILDMLQDYMDEKDGQSILISSHISSDLEKLCDIIIVIDQGKIVFQDSIDSLLNDYGFLKVSEADFAKLDSKYLFKTKRSEYGYECLTKHVRYYQENYPELVVEKGSIDEIILFLTQEAK